MRVVVVLVLAAAATASAYKFDSQTPPNDEVKVAHLRTDECSSWCNHIKTHPSTGLVISACFVCTSATFCPCAYTACTMCAEEEGGGIDEKASPQAKVLSSSQKPTPGGGALAASSSTAAPRQPTAAEIALSTARAEELLERKTERRSSLLGTPQPACAKLDLSPRSFSDDEFVETVRRRRRRRRRGRGRLVVVVDGRPPPHPSLAGLAQGRRQERHHVGALPRAGAPQSALHARRASGTQVRAAGGAPRADPQLERPRGRRAGLAHHLPLPRPSGPRHFCHLPQVGARTRAASAWMRRQAGG